MPAQNQRIPKELPERENITITDPQPNDMKTSSKLISILNGLIILIIFYILTLYDNNTSPSSVISASSLETVWNRWSSSYYVPSPCSNTLIYPIIQPLCQLQTYCIDNLVESLPSHTPVYSHLLPTPSTSVSNVSLLQSLFPVWLLPLSPLSLSSLSRFISHTPWGIKANPPLSSAFNTVIQSVIAVVAPIQLWCAQYLLMWVMGASLALVMTQTNIATRIKQGFFISLFLHIYVLVPLAYLLPLSTALLSRLFLLFRGLKTNPLRGNRVDTLPFDGELFTVGTMVFVCAVALFPTVLLYASLAKVMYILVNKIV